MTTYAELQSTRDGDIAILTLDNPARLNPISGTLQASLLRAIADIAADTSVRALVLTGAGRAFCSGADLAGGIAMPDPQGRSPGNRAADAMHAVTNQMVLRLRELPMPVVCAVNGVAAGGGLGEDHLPGDLPGGLFAAEVQTRGVYCSGFPFSENRTKSTDCPFHVPQGFSGWMPKSPHNLVPRFQLFPAPVGGRR